MMRLRQGLHLRNHPKVEEGGRGSGDRNKRSSGRVNNAQRRGAAYYIFISAIIICFVLCNYLITMNTISKDSDQEVFDLQESAAKANHSKRAERSGKDIMPTVFFRGAAFNDDNKMHSILPKRVISVFGTESSGTTFLGTTLAVAAGVIEESETLVGGARNAEGSIEMQHLVYLGAFGVSPKLTWCAS